MENVRTVGIHCFLDVSICLETPTNVFMPITAKMQLFMLFLNYFYVMHQRRDGENWVEQDFFYTDSDMASTPGIKMN